ncbi:MAG: glycoside hydrolase family 3 protein [Phycisphaerae bacterium]
MKVSLKISAVVIAVGVVAGTTCIGLKPSAALGSDAPQVEPAVRTARVVSPAFEWEHWGTHGAMYCRNGLTPTKINQQVDAILTRLTLAEKIRLLSGAGFMRTRPIRVLGIPALKMSNASVGVGTWGPATAFPASEALASSWDPALAREEGSAIGQECRRWGVNIVLGPGMDIVRVPQGGRNFEYVGEDPVLATAMVVPWIRGVQSQGVAACAKHYAGNEQEYDRFTLDCKISRRAMEEIYLPPFKAAVEKGGVWTFMAAFNRVNGVWSAQNPFLLTQMLRQHWNFPGIVMSDWGATHSTLRSLVGGLDLEMPDGEYLSYHKVKPLINRQLLPVSVIDDHVRRLLRMMIAMGFMQPYPHFTASQRAALKAHDSAVALQVAAEGTVLLKNSRHLLPFGLNKPLKIAIVGPMAWPAATGGGGSSYTTPNVVPVSMVRAMQKAGGRKMKILWIPYPRSRYAYLGQGAAVNARGQRGFKAEYFNNANLKGKPTLVRRDRCIKFYWPFNSLPREIINPVFSIRWTGKITPKASGNYPIVCGTEADPFNKRSQQKAVVYLNGKPILSQASNPWPGMVVEHLQAAHTYALRIDVTGVRSYPRNEHLRYMPWVGFGYGPLATTTLSAAQKVELKSADAVVACMGFGRRHEFEGSDRTWKLPGDQNSYLSEVAGINPHTVAVIYAGGGIDMQSWIHKVAGLVYAWYPGENGNLAVARILFGQINPSGRLPCTFALKASDEPAFGRYPLDPGSSKARPTATFAEGIYVGYRWYDKHDIQPLFCFGQGLSYTHFAFGKPQVSSKGHGVNRVITVRITVTNTGLRAGAEVVQLYVHPLVDRADRSVQQLRGFKRVMLSPGQSKIVAIRLTWRDFAYYDEHTKNWRVPVGAYELGVGDSSRDEPAVLQVHWGAVEQ